MTYRILAHFRVQSKFIACNIWKRLRLSSLTRYTDQCKRCQSNRITVIQNIDKFYLLESHCWHCLFEIHRKTGSHTHNTKWLRQQCAIPNQLRKQLKSFCALVLHLPQHFYAWRFWLLTEFDELFHWEK